MECEKDNLPTYVRKYVATLYDQLCQCWQPFDQIRARFFRYLRSFCLLISFLPILSVISFMVFRIQKPPHPPIELCPILSVISSFLLQ